MKSIGNSRGFDLVQSLAQELNPPQKEAMQATHGPLLILAGAGSGKTRVLTYRTANIIAQGLANPEEILAVTFTNKAAREMEGRIVTLLRKVGIPIYEKMWISTFHSICARILREHIELLGFQPFFGIYDSNDQISMIKKVLVRLNIDEKTFPAKTFAARINSAKTEGLSPMEISKGHIRMDERTIQVYTQYEEEMKRANSVDFADLLLKTYQIFRDYPEILAKYQEKFKFILVDEYQDTNRIQYLLVQKLASAHRNLCVVGDEDQSIYSWRGADIKNILDFESDFVDAKVVKLEQNYRSTKSIIDAATFVIQNNTQRKHKTLYTENQIGDPIVVREEASEYDEARFVVSKAMEIIDQGDFQPNEIAIFYRTNAQSRVLEEQCRARNLAYRIVGGMKFYERMEIKDVIAYMKLLLNPTDDIALKRIINVPGRGIGKTTIDRLEEFSAERNLTMFDGLTLAIDHRVFNAAGTRKLRDFLALIETLRNKTTSQATLQEIYHAILDETGYVKRLKEDNSPESESRIENLEEFDNAISRFAQERGEEATLRSFLEEMSLVSDQDTLDASDDNALTMMTLHISKGLEYPVVFIVGMEEGLFPSGRSIDPNSTDPTALEEERRLCYVGMTRAERKLFMTYARSRKVWGMEQTNPPSRFLGELPDGKSIDRQSSMQRPKFLDRMKGRYGQANSYDPHADDVWPGDDSWTGRSQASRSSYDGSRSNSPGWGNQSKGQSLTRKATGPSPSGQQGAQSIPNYEDFGDVSYEDDFADTSNSKPSNHRPSSLPKEGAPDPFTSSGRKRPWSSGDTSSSKVGYQRGSRVRHPTYGVGSIYQIEGSGDDQKVTVLFSDNTIKKFVAKYARLEKI